MRGMEQQQILVSTQALDIVASAVEPSVEDMASWRDRAACRGLDPDQFFPDEGDHLGIERAKQTCASCPVAWECLSYAIWSNQTEGIWGGTTRGERRKYRRQLIKEFREVG